MPKKPTTQSRHEKVKKAFDDMHDTRVEINGKKIRKYNYEYCLAVIASQYDYEPSTLRRIINGYV